MNFQSPYDLNMQSVQLSQRDEQFFFHGEKASLMNLPEPAEISELP